MVSVADTSPYLYVATSCFILSSLSSDLLFLRIALSFGFLFLVLASLSGYDPHGRFLNMPLSDGVIDITMWLNVCLFLLNSTIVVRLIRDEWPRDRDLEDPDDDPDKAALFYFFRRRCGLTIVEFLEIYKHGKFRVFEKGTEIPDCRSSLHLVVDGKLSATCMFHGNRSRVFYKRSGQFFDVKLFNLFTLPVGFDNRDFQATVLSDNAKLFSWTIDGLFKMRNCQSPNLSAFWEFTVLRSLGQIAILSHLNEYDTLYDAYLIPEEPEWLEGARSRDFDVLAKTTLGQRGWQQLGIIYNSFIHMLPPRGVRHFPGILCSNPKQAELEKFCQSPPPQTTTENVRKSIRGLASKLGMSGTKGDRARADNREGEEHAGITPTLTPMVSDFGTNESDPT